jgi:hemolysin III
MPHGERLNTITHLFGAAMAFIGAGLLMYLAHSKHDTWKFFCFAVYGATTVWLYFSSTLYHGTHGFWKEVWRRFDYTGIYLKIAGNYTPFALLTLAGTMGWMIASWVWVLALVGIAQELYIGKKTRKLSMIIYVLMSAAIVPALHELYKALPAIGFVMVMAGFISYVIGMYFYTNDEKIKHGHGIWHMFVLGGSALQYLCLLLYVV